MTHNEQIKASLNKVLPHSTGGNWATDHLLEFKHANVYPSGSFGVALATIIKAAANYADNYEAEYKGKIGSDGVLGEHWQAILEGVRGLLNGEINGLDGGTTDTLINGMLAAEGFNTE